MPIPDTLPAARFCPGSGDLCSVRDDFHPRSDGEYPNLGCDWVLTRVVARARRLARSRRRHCRPGQRRECAVLDEGGLLAGSIRTRPSRRLLIALLCLAVAAVGAFTPSDPAVAQTGLELDDFVFFANDQVHIRPSANVASGDVAARTNAFTTTPEIRLDNGATVSGPGSTTYGDVIQMASGSTVQNAAYNTNKAPEPSSAPPPHP